MNAETIIEKNRIKVSKVQRKVIENFIGVSEGYLSEWITWNDIMPVLLQLRTYGFTVNLYWTPVHTNPSLAANFIVIHNPIQADPVHLNKWDRESIPLQTVFDAIVRLLNAKQPLTRSNFEISDQGATEHKEYLDANNWEKAFESEFGWQICDSQGNADTEVKEQIIEWIKTRFNHK